MCDFPSLTTRKLIKNGRLSFRREHAPTRRRTHASSLTFYSNEFPLQTSHHTSHRRTARLQLAFKHWRNSPACSVFFWSWAHLERHNILENIKGFDFWWRFRTNKRKCGAEPRVQAATNINDEDSLGTALPTTYSASSNHLPLLYQSSHIWREGSSYKETRAF